MKKGMLSPSIMCANLLDLRTSLHELEQAQADLLHVDVMDGAFVPNFAFGTDFIRTLGAATPIPLDIHLMVQRPEEKLDWFTFRPGDHVSVHAEATQHLQKALSKIRGAGAYAGVALNPATPVETLSEVLSDMDFLLLMTVNPGFAGQKIISHSFSKLQNARAFLTRMGYPQMPIEVDGNVSFEHAPGLLKAGADILVGGSSSVFSKEGTLAQNVARLREMFA